MFILWGGVSAVTLVLSSTRTRDRAAKLWVRLPQDAKGICCGMLEHLVQRGGNNYPVEKG